MSEETSKPFEAERAERTEAMPAAGAAAPQFDGPAFPQAAFEPEAPAVPSMPQMPAMPTVTMQPVPTIDPIEFTPAAPATAAPAPASLEETQAMPSLAAAAPAAAPAASMTTAASMAASPVAEPPTEQIPAVRAAGFTPFAAAQGGSGAGSDGTAALTSGKGSSRNRHIGLIVTLCVFAALLAAMVGGFFGARSYFSQRVAPGVTFAGEALTGQTADQVRAAVEAKVADSKVAVTAESGAAVTASLADLGVNVDVDATVDALIGAKDGSGVQGTLDRINPWSAKDVQLTLSTDKSALAKYLTAQLVHDEQQAVPSSVSYDDGAKQYVAVAGKEGQTPDPKPVEEAIASLSSKPGTTVSASVDYLSVDMPISADTAQQAANEGNKRLASKLVVNNGAKQSFTVPSSEIAKWITFTADPEAGTITPSYDDAAVKAYLAGELPDALKQDMVKASVVTDTSGKVLMNKQQGVDGITVTSTDDAVAQVIDALHSGSDVTATAQTEVTKYETDTRVVDYTSPNGDPHMVVNLSEQKAYGYRGSTLVATFNISSGKPSTPSDNGTFFIYVKYQSKTMRGADYVSPNVPYATFYNGGEAFHAAKWNPDGIAMGQPRSHGCINMNYDDAKWVYDNMPEGAMVEVIGTTPASLNPSDPNAYGTPVRG